MTTLRQRLVRLHAARLEVHTIIPQRWFAIMRMTDTHNGASHCVGSAREVL